jgi:hypothetical protein
MSKQLTGRRLRVASELLFLLGTIAIVSPGHTEVGLRVQSHPIAAPIDAYVRVTEDAGPVTGLTPDDFAVTLDDAPVDFTLTLPPNQDSAQKVSVVIVMRNNEFGPPSNDFSQLIEQLDVGDFVSVVKFAADFDNPRRGGLWVLPFTEVDDGAGVDQIQNFIAESQQLNQTGGKFLFDGLMEGMSQVEIMSATLPEGPKALVTDSCCKRFITLSDVVARANADGISIFNVFNRGWATYPDIDAEQKALARSTGGVHVRGRNPIASMGSWLRDGYRVTIPQDAIGDCRWHKLGVTVGGESRSVTFSRCDSTPNPFGLSDLYDVDVSKRVRARAVITGIEAPALVQIQGGQYSVGCTTTFTTEPGRIRPGQSICVRHTAAAAGGQEVATFLSIGGVSEWFTSTTASP